LITNGAGTAELDTSADAGEDALSANQFANGCGAYLKIFSTLALLLRSPSLA